MGTALLFEALHFLTRCLRLVLVFRDLCQNHLGRLRVSSNGMQPQLCQVSPQSKYKYALLLLKCVQYCPTSSRFRAVLNLDLAEQEGKAGGAPEVPPGPPVSDATFRSFLNKVMLWLFKSFSIFFQVGQVVAPREFRLAVYRGGLEPGLRKIAWKHLLNLYPAGLTGGERLAYLKEKSRTYTEMKSDWMSLVLQGRISDDVKTVMNMVRKDVLRTDRQHAFFAGEGNPNVTTLFNILTTYALNHQSVSYCQGMSDLASPLLVTIGEEAHTYLCFVALMQRLKPNFLLDGVAMTTKFQHLSEGLMYYDPEFYTYLKLHHADDLLFCYRWLLLEMKREL